jgi:hypothetical protein
VTISTQKPVPCVCGKMPEIHYYDRLYRGEFEPYAYVECQTPGCYLRVQLAGGLTSAILVWNAAVAAFELPKQSSPRPAAAPAEGEVPRA